MPRTPCYLYVYENPVLQRMYIGIGESPARIWQDHNPDALQLLHHPATQAKITPEPFVDRKQALKAEAIAIHVAALLGREVLTNRAGTHSTSELEVAINRRPGVVHFRSLKRTAVVVLKVDPIDDRPALHGGQTAAVFRDRATRIWPLSAAKRKAYDARHLLAVQKTTGTILGDWDLTSPDQWSDSSFTLASGESSPKRARVGKRLLWDDFQPSNLVTWSNDISPKTTRKSSRPRQA